MKLQDSKPRKSLRLSRLWPAGRAGRFVVVVVYGCLALTLGYYAHGRFDLLDTAVVKTLESAKRHPKRMARKLRNFVFTPEMERIAIGMRPDHFLELSQQRDLALDRGILTSGSNDYLPAQVSHGGKILKTSLRLKGDSTDHLHGTKWSFRVRVKGDETLLGMKQFSLQHPKTRNFIYEWIFHEALRREELPALRYDFVDVTLNGRELGVYALEEHFEKRLIENSGFREGPIVRFNESAPWAQEAFREFTNTIEGWFHLVDIDTFQTNAMFSDPEDFRQHVRAITLLEAFRRGKLRTSDVFDIEKLARFFAVVDVIGAQHSINWTNVRYYYNPITSRLEPIGFDGDSGKWIMALSPGLGGLVDTGFVETMFDDIVFFEAYVKALERVSEKSYVDTLLAALEDDLQRRLDVLYSEFPHFDYYPEIFYRNQRFIREALNPIQAIHAYYRGSAGDVLEIELGNIQSMPVEVLSVMYQGQALRPAERTILPERPTASFDPVLRDKVLLRKPVDYRIVAFELPRGLAWSDDMARNLSLRYKILGTSSMREAKVFPWSYLGDPLVRNMNLPWRADEISEFPYLRIDDDAREVLVKSGSWEVDRSLVIPKGYRFIVSEGTELTLSDSASIISYSPLKFVGSEEHPIIVRSIQDGGQGIAVLSAGETSVLQHVVFENLSAPAHGSWKLTGAVTFYESPVVISHARFLNNRAEDALNVVRSDFSIENSFFADATSDAFDSDFSKGRITDSTFTNLRNDAIDASGSVIEIQDTVIRTVGDKGLSVGERSHVVAERLEISDARTGIASKDMSQVEVKGVHLSGGRFGIAVFRKKSEFGPAKVVVTDIKVEGTTTPYLVEERSNLVVDGVEIQDRETNVAEAHFARN